MKTYCKANDAILAAIKLMREENHSSLEEVSIGALFAFDDEGHSKQVLKHAGYPAAAYVRITPLRDRAAGLPDAMIVVDRAYWTTLGSASGNALIDHELTHLEPVIDKKTGEATFDAIGRPKLQIRKHDRQYGWFDEVAQRHGENSIEVRQARDLIAQTEQLYFDFARPATTSPPPPAQRNAH